MNKAIFLNRDGTILRNAAYNRDPRRVDILDHAAGGLRQFQEMGYKIVILQNRDGVGKNILNLEQADAIHQRLLDLLKRQKVVPDFVGYCNSDPALGLHPNYKPNTGLFREAQKLLDIDFKKSYSIGDKITDILAGLRLGMYAIALDEDKPVNSKLPQQYLDVNGERMPYHIVNNLREAAKFIQLREG